MNQEHISEKEDSIEGRYANMFRIGYNAFEFVLEFGQQYEESRQDRIHTRIITSPAYARELNQLLDSALQEYYEQYNEGSNSSNVESKNFKS